MGLSGGDHSSASLSGCFGVQLAPDHVCMVLSPNLRKHSALGAEEEALPPLGITDLWSCLDILLWQRSWEGRAAPMAFPGQQRPHS